jgi:hypothetical protein
MTAALFAFTMGGTGNAQEIDEDETGTHAAAEKAQELATDEVDSESEAAMIDAEGRLEVLTVEGFDLDEAQAVVQQSSLDDTQKATYLAGLDAARDKPEELAEVLERINEAIVAERGYD